MSLFLVNLLLAGGIILVLVFVRWGLHKRRRWLYVTNVTFDIPTSAPITTVAPDHAHGSDTGRSGLWTNVKQIEARVSLGTLFDAMITASPQLTRIQFTFRILNIVTTIAALVPLGFAAYNILTDNQTQALTFNLVSLATIIVTKSGIFLLTLVLIPILKAVPAGMGTTFGGIIAHKLWKRVEARRRAKSSE